MTQENSPSPKFGTEATIIIDLSSRIRNTGFVLVVITTFIFLITFIQRPAISNDDLLDGSFSFEVSRKVVQLHGDAVAQVFQSNLATFDTPYDIYAKQYVRPGNEDSRTKWLANFLNQRQDGQRQYLLLLLDDPGIKSTLYEYAADIQSRKQTFIVPVLGTKMGRDTVLFSLTMIFAALHGYYVVKVRYLDKTRQALDELRVLPDPSLLTATAEDLKVLGGGTRRMVGLLQHMMLWILPIGVMLVTWVFLIYAVVKYLDFRLSYFGGIATTFEATFAILMKWTNRKALVANATPSPSMQGVVVGLGSALGKVEGIIRKLEADKAEAKDLRNSKGFIEMTPGELQGVGGNYKSE